MNLITKVIPVGSIVVTGFFKRRYFRVHDARLEEIQQPTELTKE